LEIKAQDNHHIGRKNIGEVKNMSEEIKCIRCGSAQLAPGWIQSTGKVYFRPDKAKLFALNTADIAVNGRMCVECGTLEIVGDLSKAQKLIKA
jgi:hypothetical protein